MVTAAAAATAATVLSSAAASAVWSMTWRWLCEGRPATGTSKARLASVIRSKECMYCGAKAQGLDHFRPLVDTKGLPTGFASSPWNLVPCCALCNSSKNSRPWSKFMASTRGCAPLARSHTSKAQHARRVARLRAFETAGKTHMQCWMSQRYRKALQAMRVELKATLLAHARRAQALLRRTQRRQSKP
jgi:hypothetical protein